MNIAPKTIKISVAILLLFYLVTIAQPWNLYFLNDDFVHIPLSSKTIWVHFYFFRPFANLLTALEISVYGNNPVGFHITSILLHIITTCSVAALTGLFLKTYGEPGKYEHAAFITGCLFFIYPFHSEPLLWIIGRISTLATLFIVLSLFFFLKRSRWYYYSLSLLAFLCGLFTYEIAWMVPLLVTILAIIDHFRFKTSIRKIVSHALPFWLLFAGYLFIRSYLLHTVLTQYEFGERQLAILTLIGNFFRLFARTVIPPAENTTLFIIIFSLAAVLLAGLLFFLIKNKKIKLIHTTAGIFLVLSYLPVITLGIDTHGSEGERYLYLPSVFWIFLLVAFIYELPAAPRLRVATLLAFVYALLLVPEAGNYRHASATAEKIIITIRPSVQVHRLIALNLPANYKGALILRSGFEGALQWIRPDIHYDSVIVVEAERTYRKVPYTIKETDCLTLQQLPGTDLHFNRENSSVSYRDKQIAYNCKTDLLLYFEPTGACIIVYPGNN